MLNVNNFQYLLAKAYKNNKVVDIDSLAKAYDIERNLLYFIQERVNGIMSNDEFKSDEYYKKEILKFKNSKNESEKVLATFFSRCPAVYIKESLKFNLWIC